jgi:hypothetical protein
MMVAMVPGKDGVPWYLCPRCWEDGLKPTRELVTTVEVRESYSPTNDLHVGSDPPGLKAHTYEYTTRERLTTEEAAKIKTKRRARSGGAR